MSALVSILFLSYKSYICRKHMVSQIVIIAMQAASNTASAKTQLNAVHLRCSVSRCSVLSDDFFCSHDGICAFIYSSERCCAAKVTEHPMPLIVQKHIFCLQISVEDVMLEQSKQTRAPSRALHTPTGMSRPTCEQEVGSCDAWQQLLCKLHEIL